MTIVLLVLAILCAYLACTQALQARIFYRREEQWRLRERQLVDRLLLKANVAPLEVERHKVLQIDDDPTPNKSPVDQAFEADDVKEEIEQIHPDARWMTVDQVKDLWAQDWQQIEARQQKRKKPFRVE